MTLVRHWSAGAGTAGCSHYNYADQTPYHFAPVSAVNVFTNSIFRFATLGKYSASLLPARTLTPAQASRHLKHGAVKSTLNFLPLTIFIYIHDWLKLFFI